jgi:hypothetical protein
MTNPQRAEDDKVLVNPATGMPETREERDRREEQLKNAAEAEKNNK